MNPYDRRLKSSSVPVLFIPFKNNEEKCNYCGTEYAKTLEFEQKYCKNCLFWYIKYEGDNITCLEKYVITKKTQCIEHKAARDGLCATDTQEWSEYDCPEILYFTHLIPNTSSLNNYLRSSFSETFDINNKIIEEYRSFYLSEHELKYIHQESASHYQKWCQKWCSQCFIIYTGCRYCLTTNIIFGIANQSRCRNCKSISLINIDTTNIASENYIIDDFVLIFKRDDTNLNSFRLIRHLYSTMVSHLIEWFPYSRKIGEGGFSIIYKATWSDGIKETDVALKKLSNSQNMSKYFFNELRSLSRFTDDFSNEIIIKNILSGLQRIHLNNLIHRDLHSGNVLLKSNYYWQIGDFGLSQPANNTSSNNEIYGVIPYIAPEIFKGDLIYEIIDGKRPEITYDTPEYLANLIKQCWDSDPSKRPDIDIIRSNFSKFREFETLEQAENKRLKLIQLKKLGPEFSEKTNPKAIYTSRALSSLISKTSTISSSINSFSIKQVLGYITKEYELDINKIQSSSIQNINTCSQQVTKSQHQNVSGPLNNLISTVTVNSSRKRSIEELDIKTQKTKKNKKNINADNLDEELC
ncbi:kinase-like domain-containing protein [Rhizophagus clarus]|uniref:Kinase-like domain-containing protein n=1 Tax=Rhizophagus clarus TaxID=94130 RepID=A0A8H3QWF6_9GLOM|nr:kinase-like domain-containing protein [Rhizophagus clarus]